jgi:hypothetical protein
MGSYNPITGIWTIGELPFGETASLVIYSIVHDPGYYINQVTITSLTYNSNPVNTIKVIIHAVKPSENTERSSEETPLECRILE